MSDTQPIPISAKQDRSRETAMRGGECVEAISTIAEMLEQMLMDDDNAEEYWAFSEEFRNPRYRVGLVVGIKCLSHLAMLEFERIESLNKKGEVPTD